MSAYIPVLIWLISACICYYIAKRRNIKSTLTWRLIVVFWEPLAIPLIFLAKSKKPIKAQ